MKNLMLNIKISLLLAIVLLHSCGEDGDKTSDNNLKDNIRKSIDLVDKVKNTDTYVEVLRSSKERLLKLERVDPQILVDFFPPELLNMKMERVKEGRNGYRDVSVARAYYNDGGKGADIKRIDIEIMDGAGEQGSMSVSSSIAAEEMQLEQEDADRKDYWIEKDGYVVNNSYNKANNNSTLMFVAKERYGIIARTQNMAAEEAWPYIAALNLNTLPE